MKSVGVLEHGHQMSPYIVNHFTVNDFFSQSLDLQLIILCTSDLLKKKKKVLFISFLTCFFAYSYFFYSSEHSHCKSCSSKFSRISIITNGCLDRFFVASFPVLKYIYKKHLFLLQSSHCSFLASHTYICNKIAFFMSPEWYHMLTKSY